MLTRQEWENKCSNVRSNYFDAVRSADSLDSLEKIKIESLGRKGVLTELLKALKDFSIEDKKVCGPIGNSLKNELSELIEKRELELQKQEVDKELEKVSLDLTLPPYPFEKGHLHPLTHAQKRMVSILTKLGFEWSDGPHIETEKYNFSALNIPEHHPSRDMHDTLYLDTKDTFLMRTHTSPVQIRHMLKNKPPIRIISPGKVFRNDAVDASHTPVFHQIEGLYVAKNVSMADLKSTLTIFMNGLFGKTAHVRFRPSYFPFVEPGVEVDVNCIFCKGKGCSVCKQSGWIEMLGAGMVHPKVLRGVDIDPEEYSAYAFGIGIERLAMLMYGINDIRVFYDNDLRVIKQFI
jgi:phenylalanyl-tRNA synthetase alpha chain